MLELFIELTNQIFWDGYAQELSVENPKDFQSEFNTFLNSYNVKQIAIRTANKNSRFITGRNPDGMRAKMRLVQ